MATITGRNPSADASRARCALIAVFATRLPVPITAMVGAPSRGSVTGGSNRKSGPMYESPAASATATSSIRAP